MSDKRISIVTAAIPEIGIAEEVIATRTNGVWSTSDGRSIRDVDAHDFDRFVSGEIDDMGLGIRNAMVVWS